MVADDFAPDLMIFDFFVSGRAVALEYIDVVDSDESVRKPFAGFVVTIADQENIATLEGAVSPKFYEDFVSGA